MEFLDRATMLRALEATSRVLEAMGEEAELFLVDGAVMCLVHKAGPQGAAGHEGRGRLVQQRSGRPGRGSVRGR